MHAADAIHGDLGLIQMNDVVICISKSGNTPEIKALVPFIKENDSVVNISIDPLENRGFKYHTGLSFTLFSQNHKGEIAKGGRYQTISKETATGFTIYTEKLYNTSNDLIERNLVYIPFLNIRIAEKIIKKGYKVIFGKKSNNDIELDAREMGCKYIWNNETIEKIKD